jgi:hypothetical protein
MEYLLLLTLISNPKFEIEIHCTQLIECTDKIAAYEVPPSFPSLYSDEWRLKVFTNENQRNERSSY